MRRLIACIAVLNSIPSFAETVLECRGSFDRWEIEYSARSNRPCVGGCVDAMDLAPLLKVTQRLDANLFEVKTTANVTYNVNRANVSTSLVLVRESRVQTSLDGLPAENAIPVGIEFYEQRERFHALFKSHLLPKEGVEAECLRVTTASDLSHLRAL